MSKIARVPIPTAVRRAVWLNRNGEVFAAPCGCCGQKIDVWNFHCGHIVAVAAGGTNAMSNLMTICAPCNLSMGKRNLLEFKDEFFDDTFDFEIL